MFCWITEGKEIENYLPADAIAKARNEDIREQCPMYDSLFEYMDQGYKTSNPAKVEFADKVIPHIDKNNAKISDVRDRILQLSDVIKKWNNMK
jgi:hypothetical protein